LVCQGEVFAQVAPLHAEAAHAAAGVFAAAGDGGGDLVFGAGDFGFVNRACVVVDRLEQDRFDLLGAVGIAGRAGEVHAQLVAGVEAHVGLVGQARVDQGPVEARA